MATTELGYTGHPDLVSKVRENLTGVVSTQIVEDTFNLMKNSKVVKGKKSTGGQRS